MEGLLTVLVLAYVGWCGLSYAMQNRLIFPAFRVEGGAPPRGYGVEQVWIDAEDGSRVEGWFAAARGTKVASPGVTVVLAHGNGELIDDNVPWMAQYLDLGVSVLLPEYRGYGRSGGSPSQAAITADMERFYDWLVQRPEVDSNRVVFHGRSLGGGVVAALAATRTPAAMILESTFTSVASIWNRALLPSVLCRNPFRTDAVMEKFRGPVLVFHGTRDEVIPVRHGRRLHEIIPQSRYVEMPAGHNDFPPDPEAYWKTIAEFLRENGLIQSS
jgi:fermentation-respiration switch protein FrsA (DUF1100 family)